MYAIRREHGNRKSRYNDSDGAEEGDKEAADGLSKYTISVVGATLGEL